MNEIKKYLAMKYPSKLDLVEPILFFDKDDIPFDIKIKNAWKGIKNGRHIGKQYSWLAMFCKEFSLTNMELSIPRHTNPESIFQSLMYNLDKSSITPEEETVLKNFSYPRKESSKVGYG